jgi:hypothetical protein
VTCHSEKESAAATFKGGFGYHPLLGGCPIVCVRDGSV